MSEISFSLNDLIRRRLQASIAISSLALTVGSTLFLLLSAQRIGFGFTPNPQGTLTSGISSLLSPFVVFLVTLILITGVVMSSFMVSMMMSQRRRDLGLMRAIGCPNDMIFGYFFNELLIISFLGCLIGVLFGSIAYFGYVNVFAPGQVSGFSIDFQVLLITFLVFFVFSLVVGAKPIFDTSKMKPAEVISPTYYVGLSKESRSRVLSKSKFTMKVALRGIIRHRSSTIKIVLCLCTVFTVVTVGIAGGLIAEETTQSWVQRAVGSNVVLVAHQDVCRTYEELLECFSSGNTDVQVNYSGSMYKLSDSFLDQLRSLQGNTGVDPRLLTRTVVEEVQGFVLGETTGQTLTVGDDRRETTLLVGVQPGHVLTNWLVDGAFPSSSNADEAVVGDTVSTEMFTDPLAQKVRVFNMSLDVVGVCIDPINNGRVVYVPIKMLENLIGAQGPNLALVGIDPSVNRTDFLSRLYAVVHSQDANFTVLDLQYALSRSVDYLGYVWSPILFLPLLSLVTACLVLVGFVVLTIDEHRQEFGVLRAVGASPRAVIRVVSAQNMFIVLPSYGVGVALGIMITELILVQNPLVTSFTLLKIAGLLAVGLVATFLSSLYPALRFAHKPLLETMRES
jgi:putative ABC transport system permease protein